MRAYLNLAFALTTFWLYQPAYASSDWLENGEVIFKNSRISVQYVKDKKAEYIISKSNEKSAENGHIKAREVLDQDFMGASLKKIEEFDNIVIIQLASSDGDYSFFELLALNPITGELKNLMYGDSFSLSTAVNGNLLSVDLENNEHAPDYGTYEVVPSLKLDACERKLSHAKSIFKKREKLSDSILTEEVARKFDEIGRKSNEALPKRIHFDLSNYSSVKVSC